MFKRSVCAALLVLSACEAEPAPPRETAALSESTVTSAAPPPPASAPPHVARCTSRSACLELAKAANRSAAPGCADDCVARGRCARAGETCVAGTNDDCAVAAVCVLDGLCSRVEGRCDDGDATCWQCRVGSTRDCQSTLGCHALGRCTMSPPIAGDPWATCTVGNDRDCQGAESCRTHGECTARHGACVASSKSDCERSRGCATEGRCRLAGESCVKR